MPIKPVESDVPPALIRFRSSADAGRRIAGVAAAGRILRELHQAGFARVAILVGDEGELPASCRADIARLAPGVEVSELRGTVDRGHWLAGPAVARVLELDGNWLLPAGVLKEFAESGCDAAGHGGTVYGEWSFPGAAGSAGDGVGAGVFQSGPVLRLDAPDAGMNILRRAGKPLDGIVSRRINRPVSRRISHFALSLPWARPIHATIGTALLAVAMFVSLVSGWPWGVALGGLFYQSASLFDGVDGEMARSSFRASRTGAMLDSLIDIATNLLFLVGLVIHVYSHGPMWAFYAGIWTLLMLPVGLFIIGCHTLSAGKPLSFDLLKEGRMNSGSSRFGDVFVRMLTILASRDFYAFAFSAMAVAGPVSLILALYALAALIWMGAVLLLVGLPRRAS